MVLRFNISSNSDAAAFAEACDTLFLDIWGYTEDWVDIRIDKNVVGAIMLRPADTVSNAYRFLTCLGCFPSPFNMLMRR